MKTLCISLFGASVLALFMPGLFAQDVASPRPIASASSSSQFLLRGNIVPVNGVPSWPVMSGDEVAALDVPVTIRLPDGSVVTLPAKSKARVEKGSNGKLRLSLIAGAMAVAAASAISVQSGGSSTSVAPGTASSFTLGQSQAPPTVNSLARPAPPGQISSINQIESIN